MKLLERFRRWKSSAAMGTPAFYDMLARGGFLRVSRTGKAVNVETALQVVTVLACVRVIAEGVAQVPFKVMQEVEAEDGKETRKAARKHPLYRLLHRKPNSWMSSYELRETLAAHVVLTGNAFLFLNRIGRDNRIAEIYPLAPHRVRVRQADTGEPLYQVQLQGVWQDVPASLIWHVRGLSWDGVVGLEVLRLAREAIGLAISGEESQALLMANGVRPSGFVSMEGVLTEPQQKQLAKLIKDQAAGDAQGNPLLLDRGAKWQQLAMTSVDAQHLETRRFQVEQICSGMRVLPIMTGFADKTTTYASAEQLFLAHLKYTMSPWYERIEQSANVQLLTDDELDQGYYCKFIEEGMLRADAKSTAEFLTKLIQWGVLTRNEGRDKLDLNPLPGLDEPLTPTNMATGDLAAAPPASGA